MAFLGAEWRHPSADAEAAMVKTRGLGGAWGALAFLLDEPKYICETTPTTRLQPPATSSTTPTPPPPPTTTTTTTTAVAAVEVEAGGRRRVLMTLFTRRNEPSLEHCNRKTNGGHSSSSRSDNSLAAGRPTYGRKSDIKQRTKQATPRRHYR